MVINVTQYYIAKVLNVTFIIQCSIELQIECKHVLCDH